MNRNDFLNLIEHFGPADRHTIAEINELISIFPYFQSAYMLLLKGLQNTSDVKFENQLKAYAMHIADREALYYFLKKESQTSEEPEITLAQQPTPYSDSTDTGQTVIESAKNSDDLISEIEKTLGDNLTSGSGKGHSVVIYSDEDINGSDAAVFIIDEESGSVEETKQPGSGIGFTDVSRDESEVKPDVRQGQSDLIDKFIIANPRIEPVKEKTETPNEDISKSFVEKKEEFVTETLARIYVNQGYYSRAIDIYEKLSLKFPEKSSYFASQIEKVKEYLKK